MFKRNHTPPDILTEKSNVVNALALEADSAVDVVTKTISSLELINQQLDDAVAEIDTYSANLGHTRESMMKQHEKNAAIISNFTKLLNPNA